MRVHGCSGEVVCALVICSMNVSENVRQGTHIRGPEDEEAGFMAAAWCERRLQSDASALLLLILCTDKLQAQHGRHSCLGMVTAHLH